MCLSCFFWVLRWTKVYQVLESSVHVVLMQIAPSVASSKPSYNSKQIISLERSSTNLFSCHQLALILSFSCFVSLQQTAMWRLWGSKQQLLTETILGYERSILHLGLGHYGLWYPENYQYPFTMWKKVRLVRNSKIHNPRFLQEGWS